MEVSIIDVKNVVFFGIIINSSRWSSSSWHSSCWSSSSWHSEIWVSPDGLRPAGTKSVYPTDNSHSGRYDCRPTNYTYVSVSLSSPIFHLCEKDALRLEGRSKWSLFMAANVRGPPNVVDTRLGGFQSMTTVSCRRTIWLLSNGGGGVGMGRLWRSPGDT